MTFQCFSKYHPVLLLEFEAYISCSFGTKGVTRLIPGQHYVADMTSLSDSAVLPALWCNLA
jgi:hypothetical protein